MRTRVTIAALAFMFVWSGQTSHEKVVVGRHNDLSAAQVQGVIRKYVDIWNAGNSDYPLWVVVASPGDSINVPGGNFGITKDPKAGMELRIDAELIVMDRNLTPEATLQTFAHEYGHARYRLAHPNDFNQVDSEVAALESSLSILVSEGFEYLAYREAKAFKEFAIDEPYRSALAEVTSDSLWVKYGH